MIEYMMNLKSNKRCIVDHPLHTKIVETIYKNPAIIGFNRVSQLVVEPEVDIGQVDNPRLDLAFMCDSSFEPVFVECKTSTKRGIRNKGIKHVERLARHYLKSQPFNSCRTVVCTPTRDGKLVVYSARLVKDGVGQVDYQRINDSGHAWNEQIFDVLVN